MIRFKSAPSVPFFKL